MRFTRATPAFAAIGEINSSLAPLEFVVIEMLDGVLAQASR